MKILSKRAQTIRKIVVSGLIFGLFMVQTNVASAIVLNCNQVDPDNLTDDQKILYNGGTFDPVSKYAPEIKTRFQEIQTIEAEYVEEAFEDFRAKNKCPEIEGYTDAMGVKVADSFYSAYRDAFAKKIEETFQNKASNSSLTNIAIMLFDEYSKKQNMICGIYHFYLFKKPEVTTDTSSTTLSQEEALARYTECQNILIDAVEKSNSVMLGHIKSTAAEKKATLLVEKYKAINKKLIDLNNSVARMYAFFQTFANKLLFKADKQMLSM